MNNLFLSIIFSIFIFIDLSAEMRCECRAASFFHSSKLFREIYGNVGADFQLQATTNVSECFEFWSNFDWFQKKGKSKDLNHSTQIYIPNFSLGLNYLYPFTCQHTFYLGIGPQISRVRVGDHGYCGKTNHTKTTWGGMIKTGIYYDVTDCFYLDLFLDYLYQPSNFSNHVDLGGCKIGLGAGIKF